MDTWYSGDDAVSKSCPVCCTQREHNETIVIRGLADFMEVVKRMLGDDSVIDIKVATANQQTKQ